MLTLSTALGADVTRLLELPPGAFRPVPKVHSAVVRLTFRPPPAEVHDPSRVVELVRAVFTQRRKTLANALAPFAPRRGVVAAEVAGRRRHRPDAPARNAAARWTPPDSPPPIAVATAGKALAVL